MTAEPGCDGCPVASSRRAFFRDVGVAVGAAIAASALITPGRAFAQQVFAIEPLSAAKRERGYALPAVDGVFVDESNDVILARWRGRAYAFSMRCPHKGSRLEWRETEDRVFCPKHKARFLPDGEHASGRGSRDLDRHPVRRAGQSLLVDLGTVLRADRDAERWKTAYVVL